ncbi:MAG: GDSL-type esterase/lipase family protein [Solirubrobacteraceae bacterium]
MTSTAPLIDALSPPRLGVLAFGDSITNGGGELQWGVALQSWALWTARALGLPYTGYAVDGALVSDVVREQIPAFTARSAHPDARYELGCLYIGVNDVRALDWDARRFTSEHATALAFLTERCDRVLCVTAPRDLGVPPAGAKVAQLNSIVAAAARETGALVLDLGGFGGREHVMADRVHPTALGQIAIAQRALAVLAADGLAPRSDPASMVTYRTTLRGRLRGRATYAYRGAKLRGRAGVLTAAWNVRTRLQRAAARTPR